jgi:beta-lactamase class A
MTREQALSAIELAYRTPVTVTYAGENVGPLLPESIELRMDMEATAENLDEALASTSGPEAFIRYLVDTLLQRDPETADVNAVVNYSRERLDAFLDRAAQRYDHGPLQPVPLPDAGTFRPAMPGTSLNQDASLPLLIEAVLAADRAERQVALVVETEPAPEAPVTILAEALNAALADFTGVAGIYARDLSTGQELCINCEVAFAGLSTMKVAIALELYRISETPLPTRSASLLRNMLTESDNTSANQLLAEIGSTDPYSGALRVTDFVAGLGLASTYLAAPYDLKEGAVPVERVTPANSRTDISTDPDPYIQTTPMEMGLLLESVYHCAHGGGILRLLYPQALPPSECEELLAWMALNSGNSLLGEGMPAGTLVAHKHGYRGDTHADVAIVYGTRVDFVLVTFLYQPEWLVWEESVPTFARIGGLTYRFYNGDPALAAGSSP